MLHYSIDHEIVNDLYQTYLQWTAPDAAAFRQLGEAYLPLLDEYELDERTIITIQKLCDVQTEEDIETVVTKLTHGYLSKKADMRNEEAEYLEFISHFKGDTYQALKGLLDHVLNQKIIPYRIKNRCMHIDVVRTGAMSLELEFEDVLIEDGRHPREIKMTHLSGEQFVMEENQRNEDGTFTRTETVWNRIRFINGLTDEKYQTKESAFIFRNVEGTLHLYNYGDFQGTIDVNADKVPWRYLMCRLHPVMEKAQILGIESLNGEELQSLPVLCVFYELISFYLQDTTVAGVGKSLIAYDEHTANAFAFSREDIEAVCNDLEAYGFVELCEWLRKAHEDRAAFCRFWIQYATMKKSQPLYDLLLDILSRDGQYYEKKPMALSYKKFHGQVRRMLNEFFCRMGWRGEFPGFRRLEDTNFIEVSTVYSKMYTYLNEKKKGYFIDFIESSENQNYVLTAVTGYLLLREEDDARNYSALQGYFLDGGRRNSQIVGQITIEHTMGSEEVRDLLNVLVEKIMTDIS